MPVSTARIYDPPSNDDGFRLLVMRFWPRGVRKDRVDAWDRGLAPSRELLNDLNHGAIEWAEYVGRFHRELMDRADSVASLVALRDRAATDHVTLLCWCRDESRCHRTLLRGLVEVRGA